MEVKKAAIIERAKIAVTLVNADNKMGDVIVRGPLMKVKGRGKWRISWTMETVSEWR